MSFIFSQTILKEIIAVNRLDYTTLRTAWHRDRQCYALTVKKEGRTIYRTLDGTPYLSDQNHVLLLKSGISYSYTIEELGECIMIEFDGQLSNTNPEIISFNVNTTPALGDILDRLEAEWTFKRIAYRTSCMSMFYQIFSILERHEVANTISLRYYKLIQPAIEYMAHKYGNPQLNNDMLAQQANMSTSYFRRIFKKIFLVTPMQYLQDMRISKVKDLLLTEQLSISEVSSMSGFSSLYYFDYVFKKETGMTPTEYVNLYVIEKDNHTGRLKKRTKATQ